MYFAGSENAWLLSDPSCVPNAGDQISEDRFELGVSCLPRRVKHSRTPPDVREYSTRQETTKNCDLDALDWFLQQLESIPDSSARADRGKVLWRLLVKCVERQRDFFKGHYEWFYYSEHSKTFDASFVTLLRNKDWLPTTDGSARKPTEVCRDDLPSDLDPNEELIQALHIRASTEAAEKEKERTRAIVAQQIGLNNEDLDNVDFLRRYPNEFLEWRNQIQARQSPQPAFPIREVQDLARRQEKIREQVRNSPDKQYETRERSVRTSSDPSKRQPDAYLRHNYTKDDGQMVCQICKSEMPFKKRNGKYYFERVEAFDLDKEHEANYLALCPVCAAKYLEFIVHDPGDSRKNVQQALLEGKDREALVDLGDERTSIRFVEAHFIDLKTVLESC